MGNNVPARRGTTLASGLLRFEDTKDVLRVRALSSFYRYR